MKLQIKYNFSDFSHALTIAEQTAHCADILEVGSLLIFQEGVKAISIFKNKFPDKEIYADAKIAEKGEHAVTIFAQAGAKYISVLAGAPYSIIKKAATTAAEYNARIVLDFVNATSIGQAAIDAKTLGASALFLHRRSPASTNLADLENDWQQIRDNCNLPIFIEGKINQEILKQLVTLKPEVVVVGSAITEASNPAQEAKNFKTLLE